LKILFDEVKNNNGRKIRKIFSDFEIYYQEIIKLNERERKIL